MGCVGGSDAGSNELRLGDAPESATPAVSTTAAAPQEAFVEPLNTLCNGLTLRLFGSAGVIYGFFKYRISNFSNM